jgi:RimJ/RimL family protein N-acetyltransferase
MTDVVFETERLIARDWDPDRDADAAFAIYGDTEVTRHIGGETMADVEATRARLFALLERNVKHGAPFGGFPLFVRASGELVGAALMKALPDGEGRPTEAIEVGWHLARAAWGHGYASEAGRALLVRCFALTGEAQIHAVVEADNPRSMAVARRIGMRHLGQTDRFYGKTLELFAITREEHACVRA